MNHRKTLLLALDFGPHTETVLNETIAFADVLEATLHVIHVLALLDKRMSRNTYAYFNRSKQAQLAAAGARCRAHRRLGSLLLHEGDPASQILLAADALAADMIVMGARARRPARRIEHGSVIETVLRKAACTVVIVRNQVAVHDDN
ncbi:MAG TPA: universal stress protein [Polyangiales bacterium]|nr:universal stress protein [Polyangiales bacterium]